MRVTRTRECARRLTGALALLALLGVVGAVCADDLVYKWVDAQGRQHYSDRPPEGDVKAYTVETIHDRTPNTHHESAPAPAARPNGPPQPSPIATLAATKAVATDMAGVKSEQCQQAKERYDSFLRSRRIYKEGPDKERAYLSDAEIEEARVNARREVDELCKQ